jgi:hypothetical protein
MRRILNGKPARDIEAASETIIHPSLTGTLAGRFPKPSATSASPAQAPDINPAEDLPEKRN